MKLSKLAMAVVLGTGLIGHAQVVLAATTTIKIVAFNDFHGQLESPADCETCQLMPQPPFLWVVSTGWPVTSTISKAKTPAQSWSRPATLSVQHHSFRRYFMMSPRLKP